MRKITLKCTVCGDWVTRSKTIPNPVCFACKKEALKNKKKL